MEYNDLSAGTVVGEKTFEDIRPADMKIVSALFDDPNPIHFDRRSVEEQDLPGLVNQGPINMSYVTQSLLEVTRSPRHLRSLEVRINENVFEGETVTARAIVRETRTVDGERLADFDVELEKLNGSRAITGKATVCFPKPTTDSSR